MRTKKNKGVFRKARGLPEFRKSAAKKNATKTRYASAPKKAKTKRA